MGFEGWLHSLKVGDRVCDCSYRHQVIVELTPEYTPKRWVKFLLLLLPDRLMIPLWDWVCSKGNSSFADLWDKYLILADGSHCSARYCCHPDSHADWPCSVGE